MKIKNKIILANFVVAVLLTVSATCIFYNMTKNKITEAVYESLRATVVSRANHIRTYLEDRKEIAVMLSDETVLEDTLLRIHNEDPDSAALVGNLFKELNDLLQRNVDLNAVDVLNREGIVIASTIKENVGKDKSADAAFLSGMRGPYVTDAHYSEIAGRGGAIDVSAPVISVENGELLGIAIFEYSMTGLNKICVERAGLGTTGEIYLINKNGYMLTPSRFKENVFLKQKVDTENSRNCLSHKTAERLHPKRAVSVFPDYRGISVLGTHEYIEEMAWGLLAEIGAEEVFASLKLIKIVAFWIIAIVLFLAVTIGVFISGFVSAPLEKLQKSAELIAVGEFGHKTNIETNDEIGQLSTAFDRMSGYLENMRKELGGEKELLKREVHEKTRDLQESNIHLEQALEDVSKSRDIMLSMLEDSRIAREKLERNLEELRKTHDMLVQSEKLASLGRLVSDVAHEVNNPLMVISGRAQLNLMEAPEHDKLKKDLEIIVEQCDRAKDIIQRLLKFSKPSKGEVVEVDANKAIDSVVSILEHQYSLKNITIAKNYDPSLPVVNVDEEQINEIFMNLFTNAADAMPDGGVITITTSLRENWVRMDFKDTGIGMSKEVKKRLFEPFFSTKEKGAGLGLSVCYGILKAHGGELRYESEVGKGTTATILLPVGGKS